MAEESLDLTIEELMVIVEKAGIEPPVGLGDDPFSAIPDNVRDYMRNSAMDTLTARGIVDGDGVVNEAVVTLLEATGSPAMVASCSTERDSLVETDFILATPDLGVHHSTVAPTVHRFVPFPPRELLLRAFNIVELRPSDRPEAEQFECSTELLESAVEAAGNGDRATAIELLEGAGVEVRSATAFVDALPGRVQTASLTVVYRPDDDTFAGGTVTWIDTGFKGLWVTEPAGEAIGDIDDDESAPLSLAVRPLSGRELADEIKGFLPDAFSQPPTPGS